MKKYKLLSCGMVAGMALTLSTALPLAYADTATQPDPIPAQVVLNQTNVDNVPMVANNTFQSPSIASDAAVVMDISTGTVVYAKNPNKLHYPASITKIMTAMIALQKGHLDDQLTASENAVSQEPDKVYLVPGESEPLSKLLYGLLLISANDAAVVIAEHYGGNVAAFADMMNAEAQRLGARNTHFANPNGLPNPHHVTTAYDMSLITRAAMQYPEFRQVVDTKSYHWQGQKWQSDLVNLNKMLYYYPGAIGVKTGFTSVAHCTLVEAATRNNQTYLAVLMDAPSNYEVRQDAARIMDYAFAHFHTQSFLKKGTVVGTVSPFPGEKIPVVASQDMVATSPYNADLHVQTKVAMDAVSHDLPAGARVGWLKVQAGDQQIASVPLVLTQPLSVRKVDITSGLPYRSLYWFVAGISLFMVLILGFWAYKRRRLQLNPGDWSTPSASQ